ncbi:MAG: zinc ribbon domain-containing protein [Clostridia bacterium]|nr:zinc ribbon domain-containing protein [Clostridia bacterium]
MKYCIHCGKEVLDDALICPNCGCSVQYDEATKSAGQTQYSQYTQYNQYNPQTQQQQTYVPPVVDNYSTLSILGLVFSFFGGWLGLILSIVAHNEAKRTGSQKSLSLSKAGIIVSSVLLGIAAFFVLIYIILIIGLIIGA